MAIIPSSSALGDSGTANALATIQSYFNVDSTVATRRLVEVRKNYFIPPEYELHVPLSGECPYDAFSCGFSLSTDALEAGLRFPLHPVIEACLEQWRISPSQMAPNSFPTKWNSRTVSSSIPALSVDETELVKILRGILSVSTGMKDMNEAWLAEAGLSPAPRAGDVGVSTIEKRPSSRVEDLCRQGQRDGGTQGGPRAGADRYFASIMTRLKCVDCEDPLVPRWSTISRSSPFWTEGPSSGEYLWGALHPTLAKQVYECSSEELINRASKLVVWFGWGSGRSSSLGGRHPLVDRGDTFLEGELKAKGQKAVVAYKASQGFKSGLEKMGRVSYEFGYRVALERLRGKHLDFMIELDPFAECSKDANVEMDLNRPFDDDTPSEKQPTL
ncbi:hypothetical protein BHM03_00035298 [Ensete ventricosum]|nr:hypothetical protein BHM03_00035298 [Ensete ventricosum]